MPEILPGDALQAGASIVGTGRNDFPNQINYAFAFPGIFRGALDVQATRISDEMKVAAARALADYVKRRAWTGSSRRYSTGELWLRLPGQ
ncbi:malic enzyme-like NAD(P)-binding protein [Methanoregula sp.]|uniref:malic enzyme-like NAD(P)-binding protein n=1 Tax=Methanoregula sp. TaxID=2052170 RepID=UPI003C7096BC